MDPYQARKNVGPDLDPKFFDTLMVFQRWFWRRKNRDDKILTKLQSVQRVAGKMPSYVYALTYFHSLCLCRDASDICGDCCERALATHDLCFCRWTKKVLMRHTRLNLRWSPKHPYEPFTDHLCSMFCFCGQGRFCRDCVREASFEPSPIAFNVL